MPRDAEREAIIRAAREAGVDPAYALAVAQRESNFNPNAHSSSTIEGLFQMQGGHRAKFGVGDSKDPYTQAKGWMGFQKEVRKEMAGPLGRDPTDAEAYLGHHFGGVRAGRMLKMDPNTPVEAVFTPREMAENPHFAKAGTVGNLNTTIVADIEKKAAAHGGQEYKADFSDGASPAGFENAAAVPPAASATGQQIAAAAAMPAAAAGPNSFKGLPNMESAPVEHIPQRPPPAALSQVGNVVPPVPMMPTTPPPAPGVPDPMAIMLGSPPQPQQDPRRLGMFGGIPV
jgi:Transglycosylase SLT domain